MFEREKYYQIGEIVKSHGVKGGVILQLDFEISYENIKKSESLFILIDNLTVPFFIEEIKPHSKDFFVKFECINSINDTNEIIESPVLIEKELLENIDIKLDFKALEGFELIDEIIGNLGRITEFIEINMNTMFEIENDDKTILIPANEDFITEINLENKQIYTKLPSGLVDL